jgi:predicted nuclease with TOPRIM domain
VGSRGKRGWLAPLLLAAGLLAAAPRTPAQQPPVEAPPSPAPSSTLLSVSVGREADETVVLFVSSDSVGLVGVQPDPDGSIAVQFPDHAPGPGVEDLFPEDSPVLAVRIAIQQTARGPLARAVITPRSPLTYSFSPEGRELRVRLRPRGAPSPSGELVALRRRAGELEASLAAARQERDALRSRLSTLSADRDLLAQRFEELEARRAGLEASLSATLAEVQALAEGPQGADPELERGRRELESSRARIVELEGALERARLLQEESDAQLQAWQAELDRVEQGAPVSPDGSVAELRQRIRELAAANAQLQSELDRLRTDGVTRAVTTTSANLRQGPGIEAPVLTGLVPRTTLEVLERDGEWLRVRAGNDEGWIYGKLAELESERLASDPGVRARRCAGSSPRPATRPAAQAAAGARARPDRNRARLSRRSRRRTADSPASSRRRAGTPEPEPPAPRGHGP